MNKYDSMTIFVTALILFAQFLLAAFAITLAYGALFGILALLGGIITVTSLVVFIYAIHAIDK